MDTIKVRKYQEKLLRRREQILTTAKHLEKAKEAVTGQRHFDWLDQAWSETEIHPSDHLK